MGAPWGRTHAEGAEGAESKQQASTPGEGASATALLCLPDRSGLPRIHTFPLTTGMLLCVLNFMFVQIKYHPVSHEELTEAADVWSQVRA